MRSLPIVPSLLTVLSLNLYGCGSGESSHALAKDSADRTLRPFAEYEPTSAIALSAGSLQTDLAFFKPGEISDIQAEHSKKLVLEYKAMVETLVKTQPSLKIYLEADGADPQNGLPTEYEMWKPDVDTWQKRGANIELFKAEEADFPGVSKEKLTADPWTRDYGSYSISKYGRRKTFLKMAVVNM
jgi:hypothetical protein